MIDLDRFLDRYNRQARLYPALLAFLPAILTLVIRYPPLLTSNATATVMTLSISCGLLFLLTTVARSRGKIAERRLLKKWGGWPTTLWLRHSDTNLPPQTKARYHAALIKHVPGLNLPTADEERVNPIEVADNAYRSAVEWLKEYCRTHDCPLVEKENAEYGFRRNLRGLRPLGVALTCVGLLATVAWSLFAAGLTVGDLLRPSTWHALAGHEISGLLLGTAALNLVALVFWLCVVRDSWVRQAGDQYARALLASCDRLS